MMPYDPLEHLRRHVERDEAVNALDLCYRLFAAGTIDDVEDVRRSASALLETSSPPTDPLVFIYRHVLAAAEERLPFLNVAAKWSTHVSQPAAPTEIAPCRWSVTLAAPDGAEYRVALEIAQDIVGVEPGPVYRIIEEDGTESIFGP